MGVGQRLSIFIAHGGLKLVYPNTRIYRHDLPFHGLQPAKIEPTLLGKEEPTYITGRPTGVSKLHNDLTPMLLHSSEARKSLQSVIVVQSQKAEPLNNGPR